MRRAHRACQLSLERVRCEALRRFMAVHGAPAFASASKVSGGASSGAYSAQKPSESILISEVEMMLGACVILYSVLSSWILRYHAHSYI